MITDEDLKFVSRGSTSKIKADAIMAEALSDLRTSREDIVNSVVFGLNWKLKDAWAYITRIYNDQWSAVVAEGKKYDTEEVYRTYIQCDRVEDGFAATWIAMKRHFGLNE
jgi:hypothetical protein